MRHVLLRPRWLAGHLLALALVVLFVNLGLWQLRRLEQRRAHVAQVVERGWVPYAMDRVPVAEAPPPAGKVTVTGRLRRPTGGRAGSFGPRDPAEGELVQAYYVDVERLQGQMPYPLVEAYVELTSVTPPHPGDLPLPLPEPDLGEGPHLSYAVQWFSFAAIGIVGYFFLLRRAARDEGRG